jgi:Flp pilus assembly protein TadD
MRNIRKTAISGSQPVAMTLVLIGALAFIAGCASQDIRPDTREAITIAETTIRQAEQAAGREYSTAELIRARDKLEEARRIAEDEPVLAERLARESAVDAELAASLAREGQSEEAVAQIREDLRVLRDEAAR